MNSKSKTQNNNLSADSCSTNRNFEQLFKNIVVTMFVLCFFYDYLNTGFRLSTKQLRLPRTKSDLP